MEMKEYVDRYIEMIQLAVTRLYPECDLTSRRSMNLLHNEYLIAKQEFETYLADYGMEPDQSILMARFENWGISRSDLFWENERVISEADFVEYHLGYVKSGDLLKVTDFTEEDYRFILDREAYFAREMFKHNYQYIEGYRELDIRCSKKRQDYCLQASKKRFEKDYKDFYSGMKKN
ncbi:hypothetical protein ACNZ61_003001 [Enterococcus hirae]